MDLSKWKKFKIKELFNVYGSKTTNIVELETKYIGGNYAYVTTKASNNGVEDFYDYYTEKGNVLTVDSAVIGYVTYQDRPFTASDHVEILEPKEKTVLNKNTALFLKTIIQQIKQD